MKSTPTYIRELLEKYIDNNYTKEEFDQLLNYLEDSDSYLFNEKAEKLWNELNSGKQLNTSEEENIYRLKARQIINSGKEHNSKKTIFRNPLSWCIAASLVLLIAGSLFFIFNNTARDISEPVQYITEKVEKGDRKQIILKDGSSISINAMSQIVYPESFDNEKREITLKGEAFFDIAPDKNRPFIVNSSDIKITVLGTSFNVKNFEESDYITITVSSGKVGISIEQNTILLSPDQQLVINKQTAEFEKISVDASKYTQWQQGILYFNRTPIEEVIETLNKWYDVDIKLQSNYQIFITGEHDNKSLDAVIESICFATDLRIKKNEKTYILYK